MTVCPERMRGETFKKVATLPAIELKRYRDRVLVNVQSDVCARLVHDLPSSLWLCVKGPDLEHNPRASRLGQVNP